MSNFQTFFTGMADRAQAEATLADTQAQTEERRQKIAESKQEIADKQSIQQSAAAVFQPTQLGDFAQPTPAPAPVTDTTLTQIIPKTEPTPIEIPPLTQLGMTQQEQDGMQAVRTLQTKTNAAKMEAFAMSLYSKGLVTQADKVMEQSTRMAAQASDAEKEQWQIRKGHIELLANAMNLVHDQKSLDETIQRIKEVDPAATANIPKEYNATTAPIFRRAGLVASSALQQVEIQQKMFEVKTQEEKFKVDMEHKQQETIKSKADVQKMREGIADPATKIHTDYRKKWAEADTKFGYLMPEDRQATIDTYRRSLSDSYVAQLEAIGRRPLGQEPAQQKVKQPATEQTQNNGNKPAVNYTVKTAEDYAALPKGSTYTDPDGVTRIKQ